MRLRVRHDTVYRYSDPVRSAIQLLRVTPRSTDNQFVRRWRVSIEADARLDRGEDAYGNITHLAYVDGPYDTLRILVEGDVETSDAAGLVQGSVERVSERLFLRDSRLTLASPAIRDLARDAMAMEGGDALAALHRVNTSIQSQMRFDPFATTTRTSAAEAFANRAGVCQDFAHIFIAAARSLGVPARYVSGYYLRTDTIEQDAGHAWAEAFLPTLGWIAFDPAHATCTTERYIRIAVGPDGQVAAPVRGARNGGHTETLSVGVTVAPGRAVLDSSASMMQSQSQGRGNEPQ
jgi:transglutaminase-like putative cysteine protease